MANVATIAWTWPPFFSLPTYRKYTCRHVCHGSSSWLILLALCRARTRTIGTLHSTIRIGFAAGATLIMPRRGFNRLIPSDRGSGVRSIGGRRRLLRTCPWVQIFLPWVSLAVWYASKVVLLVRRSELRRGTIAMSSAPVGEGPVTTFFMVSELLSGYDGCPESRICQIFIAVWRASTGGSRLAEAADILAGAVSG